ncbi:hypothetical protein MGG_16193 [Pyricularia oryzae 70-15]|uniref:Uncharacterized protein n=3 Tax=Pyricularia oryzae TaxID=318829 RepID=G4MMJ7_PYRO7|nr:uncharacterized protein MGG_16193 [Pyricularia oryzae 70-15]EHA56975.1 hypothetical protein MGG_16193 [Pyricularia oryzae 70-15]ELQ43672.1 hypothetical protein OOU_Y34scaffold00140g80 [Pyricularia oryzae Y34]
MASRHFGATKQPAPTAIYITQVLREGKHVAHKTSALRLFLFGRLATLKNLETSAELVDFRVGLSKANEVNRRARLFIFNWVLQAIDKVFCRHLHSACGKPTWARNRDASRTTDPIGHIELVIESDLTANMTDDSFPKPTRSTEDLDDIRKPS